MTCYPRTCPRTSGSSRISLYNALVDEKAIGMTRDEFIRALWEREGIKAITQYHPTVNCLPAYRAMGHGEGIKRVIRKM